MTDLTLDTNDLGDDDFSDLEGILHEGMQAMEDEMALKAAKKRLGKVANSNHPEAEREQQELVATIRRLEEGRVWRTIGSVALFKSQMCASCTGLHRFFQGWYTEQNHVSDPNARRLLAGKCIELLPERIEIHNDGLVELCINCVETHLAIDEAIATHEEVIR